PVCSRDGARSRSHHATEWYVSQYVGRADMVDGVWLPDEPPTARSVGGPTPSGPQLNAGTFGGQGAWRLDRDFESARVHNQPCHATLRLRRCTFMPSTTHQVGRHERTPPQPQCSVAWLVMHTRGLEIAIQPPCALSAERTGVQLRARGSRAANASCRWRFVWEPHTVHHVGPSNVLYPSGHARRR